MSAAKDRSNAAKPEVAPPATNAPIYAFALLCARVRANEQKEMKWLLYGREFFLEDFANAHPGGDLALILGAGRDCTTLFEQYHKRPKASLSALKRFGDVEVKEDPFHAELLLAARGIEGGTHATWFHTLLCGALAVLVGLSWIFWARGSVLALLALPFLSWLLSVNVAHDAAHFAFSANPAANEILALLSAPLIYNTSHWYLQHDVSHHCHTNEHGKDIDLLHFSPLARLHQEARWRPQHVLQLIVVAASFLFATLAETFVFPFFAACKQRQLGEPRFVERRTRIASAMQMLASLAVLVAPFSFLHERGLALTFALVPFLLTSALFMSVTQVSHVQASTQALRGAKHWTALQVESSLDYDQGSWLTTFLTGGLNCQGLHHCLPLLSSSRFVEFYPTYRRICERHGYRIREARSFWAALGSYWAHVHKLSFKS